MSGIGVRDTLGFHVVVGDLQDFAMPQHIVCAQGLMTPDEEGDGVLQRRDIDMATQPEC